jgi:hypothetical protein
MKQIEKRKGNRAVRWIKIAAGVAVFLFGLNVLLVFAQGVSFDYWRWLGYPSSISIFYIKADNYPGHTLNCLRNVDYIKFVGDATSVYEKAGSGIDKGGFHVHIGDTRQDVIKAYRYFKKKEKKDDTAYRQCCNLCSNYYYDLKFEYDKNDRLTKITIQKNHWG